MKNLVMRTLATMLMGTIAFCVSSTAQLSAAEPTVIKVWPQTPPGRIAAKGEEADTSNEKSGKVAERTVIRLGNVSSPTLTIYQPEKSRSDAAVLVCPGGGYNILAMDLEGTEVCEWLNQLGITAGLLKYRVPRPEGDPKPIEPLQDAQRAMAILRSRAAELKLDPKRIGVLGFSAGGHLSARLSNSAGHRAYEPIDAVDQQEFVPNFTLLIYPAYLYDKNDKDPEAVVSADIPVSKDTPPAFVTMAVDDPVDSENALRYATALKRAKVPVSLHLYPSGGHGYGLRSTKSTSTTWPDRAEEWLKASGYLAE